MKPKTMHPLELLIREHRINGAIAEYLAKKFHNSPEFWFKMQKDYDNENRIVNKI